MIAIGIINDIYITSWHAVISHSDHQLGNGPGERPYHDDRSHNQAFENTNLAHAFQILSPTINFTTCQTATQIFYLQRKLQIKNQLEVIFYNQRREAREYIEYAPPTVLYPFEMRYT